MSSNAFLRILLLTLIALSMLSVLVYAQADDGHDHEHEEDEEELNLEEQIRQNSILFVTLGSITVTILVLLAIIIKRKYKWKNKKNNPEPTFFHFIFWPMVLIIIVVTAYVAGGTVYLNIVSETGGPVHWHADYEIWNCGENLDIKDATGLSNRIGSPVLHDHGDNRIHIEGVVVNYEEASLKSFLRVIGGELNQGKLKVPVNDGVIEMVDGQNCPNGSGTLQVFVYKTVDNTATQEKLTNYPGYVLSPHTIVPPGDCVIFEFDSEQKETTDKICETYEIALDKGVLNGG
jgi:hypothetical protein